MSDKIELDERYQDKIRIDELYQEIQRTKRSAEVTGTKQDIELRKQVDIRRCKVLRLAKKIYIGILQKETSINSYTGNLEDKIRSSVIAAREFIDKAGDFI